MSGVFPAVVLAAIALLLRSTALSALAARGVVVDVLAFAVAVWALRRGESAGTLFGFALGLVADLDAAHWLGRHALVLSVLGYTLGRISHTLVREQARTTFVVLLAAVGVHQAWVVAFEVGSPAGWPHLARQTLLAMAATAPLGTVILALLQRIAGRSWLTHGTVGQGA